MSNCVRKGWMNRLLASATYLAALTTASAAFALGPTAVVNYDFSEGTGTMPQDTTPNNNDGSFAPGDVGSTMTGGAFTGPTPSGGTGYLGSGKFGGALWFTDASSQFAQFHSTFDISNEGSISLFANWYDLFRRSTVIDSSASGTGGIYVEKYRQDGSGTVTDDIFWQMGGTTHYTTANNSIGPINEWHHIVMTWSASGNIETVYLNGTAQTGLSSTYNDNIVTLMTNFRFGSPIRSGLEDQAERRLRGGIDDIAFYSSRLTVGEIATISTGGAAAVTANQVVHWNLDDAIGTTIAPSDGGSVALNLYAGAATPGTPGIQEVTYVVAGGPTLAGGSYAAAQTLDAVDFTGASTTNNKITIPNDATLDWVKTQGSVVMWINPDTANVRQALWRTTGGTVNIEAEIGANGTNSVFFQIGSSLEISASTAIVNGQWQHLAFVWDNSLSLTDQMRIYRNGTLLTTTAQGSTFGIASDVSDWLIGHRPDILARNYNGDMADFGIFNVALSVDEINDIILNGTLATFTPVQEPQPQPQPQPGTTGGGGGAVPEPASLALLGLSALALMRRRR